MAKTVQVRVMVAVDRNGHWASAGWCVSAKPPSDQAVIDCAIESLEQGERRYWLLANLELPGDAEEVNAEAVVEDK